MGIQMLQNCHDCGAKPGETHMPGCDTERCSVCGGQKIGCNCEGHDQFFARWTGLWPGAAECSMLGLFSKWSPETGWVKTDANDPDGSPDLNTFYSMGLNRVFFVKPTKDTGTERYEDKNRIRQQ